MFEDGYDSGYARCNVMIFQNNYQFYLARTVVVYDDMASPIKII